MKIGVIGYGKMGRALIKGAVDAGAVSAKSVRVWDTISNGLGQARRDGMTPVSSLASLVNCSDVIFLCVKPQSMAGLFSELRAAKAKSLKKICFVSIAAGIRLRSLEEGLGRGVSVFRVMPNTPALLQSGVSGVCRGRFTTAKQAKLVDMILRGVGDVVWISDAKMDALTAVSGSGPAYIFYLAEGLLKFARSKGFSATESRRLVHRTFLGAGRMLADLSGPADVLRKNVTSPGGTTEAAIKEFDRGGFQALVARALKKAALRSRELSQKISLKPGKTV